MEKLHSTPFVTMGAFLACIAVTLMCFWPVRNFEFINFDDEFYVSRNEIVHGGFTAENVRAAFTDTRTGHWHPLTILSHALDWRLFGGSPGPHHLVNVGFHAVNGALVFLILRYATGLVWPALIAALLFSLHPLRIESVAWVSQRKDVLSMFFGLLTLGAYTWGVKRRGKPALMCLPLFALALSAKPTMITLPFLFLLWDRWPLERLLNWKLVWEKLPLFVISLLFAGIAFYSQSAGEGLRTLSETSPSDRLANALVGYLAYFGKLFAPSGLGIFYPFMTYPPGVGAGAFCGLLGLTAWFIRSRTLHPYLLTGWVWFLTALLPVIGLVQIGGQSIADRWTYLPHLGLIIGVVWYVRSVSSPKASIALGVVSLVAALLLTRLNLPHWRNSETLFRHTLNVSPDNFLAHTNLGQALDAAGRSDEAKFHFEEGVRLNPTYPEALNNLGTVRGREARHREAKDLFERALARRPDYLDARYNLGLSLHYEGRITDATNEWLTVLSRDPINERARNSIRFVLDQIHRSSCVAIAGSASTDARKRFREVIENQSIPAQLRSQVRQAFNCW